MAGDPLNSNLWTEADVYIGGLDAVNPATVNDPFGSDWDLAGLLNGDNGFVESRSEDTNDIYGWGGILIRTSRTHFKLTRTWTALEDNATTYALRWPGSSSTQIVVPRPERTKIAFEVREDDKVHRVISANYVESVLNSDVTQNETELEAYEFLTTVFPTGGGVLWIPQNTA